MYRLATACFTARAGVLVAYLVVSGLIAAPLAAQQVAAPGDRFARELAAAASGDADLAAFYRDGGYAPLWVGSQPRQRARRAALFAALAQAGANGLPAARYRVGTLRRQFDRADSAHARAEAEVALSRAFLQYARDVQTGLLVPSRIDRGIARLPPYRDRGSYLRALAQSNPAAFFRALPPDTAEYRALRAEKQRLERLIVRGGWGTAVPASGLKPGESGPAVAALRARLTAMGYRVGGGDSYDAGLAAAVRRFQIVHGLAPDGIAGRNTMAEINRPAAARLAAVVVAMERERWLNSDRGRRHVLVNLAGFSARIIDDGRETLRTRAVIGQNAAGRRSPEFSDMMEYLVFNPSWYVPRSIATQEYLPLLKKNPYALGRFEITDAAGRRISRAETDFSGYSAASFPFSMRQPPGPDNALGQVKFVFPNRFSVYLHDTPHKQLFDREIRAFSHGCIRLADPLRFAYVLLKPQDRDPEAFMRRILATGEETKVILQSPVPVHLIYRTALSEADGTMGYRRDIYGRDAKIAAALRRAGVALGAVRG